jgi:hypothetical protein
LKSRLLIIAVLLCTSVLAWPDKDKLVDSGSFGIFQGGKRVATETFTVKEQPGGSVANSEIKVDDGSKHPSQTARIEFTSAGELRRYEWHELTPVKAEALVTSSDPFLMEHLILSPEQKPVDQPFMLPNTTLILDHNFFLLRQILAWRYLASGCKPSGANMECRLPPAKFGVLIPQELTSAQVTMEYGGLEKVTVRGVQRDLYRLNLKWDGPDWSLWLDASYKLIRVVVAGADTEVVRD